MSATASSLLRHSAVAGTVVVRDVKPSALSRGAAPHPGPPSEMGERGRGHLLARAGRAHRGTPGNVKGSLRSAYGRPLPHPENPR
jgi:hypothetical protein